MKRIAVLSALMLLPAIAVAQTFTQDDNAARMSLGNDLYTAGNILTITENVPGDLFAAGNRIVINGSIQDDVQAAGSTITVNGDVGGDLRVAGGDVTIDGSVAGDVIVFGGTVYIAQSSDIAGNLLIGGGVAVIEGTVRGNVKASGGEVMMRGTVGGAAEIRGEKVSVTGTVAGNAVIAARELSVDPEARFNGDVRYWTGTGEADIGAQTAGTATFDVELAPRDKAAAAKAGAFGGILAALTIFSILSAALAIGVIQFATKTSFIDSAKRLRKSPMLSMLWGLIYFLLTPAIILLLLITLVGIPIAAAATAAYFVSLIFALILTAMVFARWTELHAGKKWHPAIIFLVSLGYWIVLKLLWFVPFLGWIAVFLAVIAGFGAFLWVRFERCKKTL